MAIVALDIKLMNKDGGVMQLSSRKGRLWKRIMREGLQETARMWHREILPRHWYPSARSEYNHQVRSAWYLKYKRRTGKGVGRYIDNIYHGKTRRFMMHSPRLPRGTHNKVTLFMDAPYYIRNIQKPDLPDSARELTQVSVRDKFMMQKFLHAYLNKRVKELQGKRSR